MAWTWNQIRCTSQQTLTQHFLRVRGCLAMRANLTGQWNIRNSAQHALPLCIGTPISSPRVPRWHRRIFEGSALPLLSHFQPCPNLPLHPRRSVRVTLSTCPLYQTVAPTTDAPSACVDSKKKRNEPPRSHPTALECDLRLVSLARSWRTRGAIAPRHSTIERHSWFKHIWSRAMKSM